MWPGFSAGVLWDAGEGQSEHDFEMAVGIILVALPIASVSLESILISLIFIIMARAR